MKDSTKNNIKIIALLIVVFIILYFLHITIGDRFEDQYDKPTYQEGETRIDFTMDSMNKTITVKEIHSGRTLHWPEVVNTSGSASIPSGTIDVGDKITNCEGFLILVWRDTDNVIFSAEFS
jgi:hypothetical protein